MSDKEWEKDFSKTLISIRKHHIMLEEEFKKLLCEPCSKVPQVGDRVVFAAGLVGMGHLWIRTEALVLEVGDTSVKILMKDRLDGSREMWIHPALITDNLGRT